MRKETLFLLLCWVYMVACVPVTNPAGQEPIAGSAIEIERATSTPTNTTVPSMEATAIPSLTPTHSLYNTLTLTPTPGPYPTRTPYVTPPPTPVVPSASEGYVSPPNCVVPDDWVMYTVQEGDTAYNLVLNTGTDLSTFYTINCKVFGSPIILGQEVALPQYPVAQEDISLTDLTEIPCSQLQRPASSGLQVGAMGEAVAHHVINVYQGKDTFHVGYGMVDGQTFTVLEGPYCFSYSTPHDGIRTHRRWHIDFVQGKGWVDEFDGLATQYMYNVVPEGQLIAPEFGFFTIYPENPHVEDVLEISWQLNGVASVDLYGSGLNYWNITPTGSLSVPVQDLTLDELGCAHINLYATAVNTNETYTQSVCFSDMPIFPTASITVSPNPYDPEQPINITWNIDEWQRVDWAKLVSVVDGVEQEDIMLLSQASGSAELWLSTPPPFILELQIHIGYGQIVREQVEVEPMCMVERLTTDPTMPQDCPALPPTSAQAFVQTFENGQLMGYAYGEAGAYQLVASHEIEAYLYNDTYVGDGDLNARVAHALEAHPEIQEVLGEPVGDLQIYTTRWQEVAGHYVVVMPDGSLARYLIYDGNYGQWIPISDQWNPNG